MSDKNLEEIDTGEFQHKSHMTYASTVTLGRALPNIIDGLKPVHRRILFMAGESDLLYNKPYKKAAKLVGDILGSVHPHGDTAVYDAVIRLGQEWKQVIPLIDIQGNKGNIAGKRQAAMRYVEARLSKISNEFLRDLNPKTVPWVPNYDSTMMQPAVLPVTFPNFLVTPTTGLAVGYAVDSLPHNIWAVAEATKAYLNNRDTTLDQIIDIIVGPDFPTGGIVTNAAALRKIYHDKVGVVTLRGKYDIEELSGGKVNIVFTEIPFYCETATIIENIVDAVRDKKIEGIVDVRDETTQKKKKKSDVYNVRLVIELKRGIVAAEIVSKLFQLTGLESSIRVNMNVITENNAIAAVDLLDVIKAFVSFREKVIRTRSSVKLAELKKQEHILEGILFILGKGKMDEVIKIIRGSEDESSAKDALISEIGLSLRQAEAVVAMRLGRLTSFGKTAIEENIAKIRETISELIKLVTSPELVLKTISDELDTACNNSDCPKNRRTELTNIDKTILTIPEGQSVISLSENGFISRIPAEQFVAQNRGGKGKIGVKLSTGDSLLNLFQSDNQTKLLAFTNTGRVFKFIAGSLPEGRLTQIGSNVKNVLALVEGESIVSLFPFNNVTDDHCLMLVTYGGKIKKTKASEYATNRSSGLIAIALNDGDEISGATLCKETDDVVIMSDGGLCARYKATDITSTGRTTQGVMGLKFKADSDDILIGIHAVDPADEDNLLILTVASNGLGKLTELSEHGTTNRPSMGYAGISLRDGSLLTNFNIVRRDADVDIMAMSENGVMIRTGIEDISLNKRRTFGSRIMTLNEGDTMLNFVLVEND
jgi:DNA gyrase subunit A